MRRADVIAKLKQAEPKLREAGVAALYLFGSHARDTADVNSDIDLFVEPASDSRFDFLKYMDAHEAIRRSIGEASRSDTRHARGSHPTSAPTSRTRRSGSFNGTFAKPARQVASHPG